MPDPYKITRFCSSLVVLAEKEYSSSNDVSYDNDASHNDDASYDDNDSYSIYKYTELQLAHFSIKEYLTSTRLNKDIAQNF